MTWISVPEASILLNMTRQAIYKAIREKRVRSQKVQKGLKKVLCVVKEDMTTATAGMANS